MGNSPSKGSDIASPETAAERAKHVAGEIRESLKESVQKLDEDHPAAQLIDTVCGGGYFEQPHTSQRKYRRGSRSNKDDYSDSEEDESRTIGDDSTYDDRSRNHKDAQSVDSSYISESYDESEKVSKRKHSSSSRKKAVEKGSSSFDDTEEEESRMVEEPTSLLSKQPLASSFAKRCYFTKAGIGKSTQHYEGLTLTGNIVLMLASAMKLKGCPTICDEDLRRVEQTYPNQFSRLPDELLLSSGWRRISKYCHFSNKPIPDGVPFFHSKKRVHPQGGFYFLLAAAVGMVRPSDVEPLTRDTLVLLETDFPTQCDQVGPELIEDPDQWTLVNKFCFFSGGPINADEDVYYEADFDGNPIYMLAFLSPSLTPEELYKLGQEHEPLRSVAEVREVESVYDLTSRDFDDLKLYHLGPCRALPSYILQPEAWRKVLPPHFVSARQTALQIAGQYEGIPDDPTYITDAASPPSGYPATAEESYYDEFQNKLHMQEQYQHFDPNVPMDETMNYQTHSQPGYYAQDPGTPRLDPPDDQPPSLTKGAPDPLDPVPVASPGDSQFLTEDKGYISPASNDEFSGGQEQFGAPTSSMQDPDGGFSPARRGQPNGHFPTSHSYGVNEEKKNGHEDNMDSSVKSGEEDFVPIKRDGFKLRKRDADSKGASPPAGSPSPSKIVPSPSAQSHDSGALSRSSALRGAQELLRKNRQRRLESALRAQGGGSADNSPQKRGSPQQHQLNGEGTAPSTSMDDDDHTWDSGSELTSVVSGSSAWTDDMSGPTERNSRRALILQMAKARMKSNKEADAAQDMEQINENEEVGPDDEIPRVSSTEEGFNLVQDLD